MAQRVHDPIKILLKPFVVGLRNGYRCLFGKILAVIGMESSIWGRSIRVELLH